MSFDHTILKGTTSKIVEVILRDSSTGAGKTAVAHTDVTASYVREGGTRTAITLAAGTAGDAYSTGRWCEVDSTNCPGLYQLHLPNAALATGVDAVTTTLTATGVIDKVVRISLLDVDLRDAADAGLSNLDAAISSRSNFDASTDTVTTDSASRTASQADVSSLATSSALSNVESKIDTVDANVDSILIDTGTDIPASIAALNDFDPATQEVTTDSASRTASQADVSSLATAASIAALNDISAADVWTYSTRTITSGGITQAEVAAAVWNASLSGYNSAGSTGKALRQIKEGVISTDGSVNDTSATTTTFISNLTETTDGFYHDKVIVFISGDLLGQARHIETYVGATKAITVSQGFTAAPSDGDEFLILATHEHSLNEISEAVWSDTHSSYTTDGTFGYYLDAQVSSAGAGGSGLYQVTVTVQNQDGDILQGARVNVDGTTLTLVTDSSGVCVFSLDSGVYTLHVSPPAGYQTPTGNVITISAADISSTFTLEATAPSGDCDVPWVG